MIRHLRSGAFALTVLLCPACTFLAPEPDPTRYAVLATVDDVPDAPPAGSAAKGVAVGLGPIAVPEYLLRPEILTRKDGTRLVPSQHERWGEPLQRGIERALSVDLAHALGAERVVLHPWYANEKPDARVRVSFSRFEHADAGRVVVRATWSIERDGVPPIEREWRSERPTTREDGAGIALALSDALRDLAREIATAWPADAGG